MRKPFLTLVSILVMISGMPANLSALSCTCTKFAYDAKNTGNTDGQCPINPEKLGLVWKTNIGPYSEKRNNSNVICDEKKIFIGTPNSVKCFSTVDFKELWSYNTNSKIVATPCITGNLMYVPLLDEEIICMKKSGEVGYIGNVTGQLYSSPVVYSGSLYIATDGGVLDCVNVYSAMEDWYVTTKSGFRSTPAFTGETIILGCTCGCVFGVSTQGKQLWVAEGTEMITSSASISGERFFIGTDTGTIVCRNVKDGSLIWKESIGGKIFSTPAIKNDCIFFGNTNGKLYCYGFDGKQKWSFHTEGSIEGNCTLDGNICYFGSNDGKVYALEQSTGKLLWSYKTDGRIQNTPTIAEGSLWVYSSDGFLHCFRDDDYKVKPEVANVEINPSFVECYVDETFSFTATAFEKDKKKIDNAKFTWKCNKENIGTVDENGVFKALNPGYCTITATSDGKFAQAQVKCLERYPDRLELLPKNPTVEFGKTIQFTATIYDNKGNVMNNQTVNWSCDSSDLGDINPSGLFTASNNPITGIVYAKTQNLMDETIIKVVEPKKAIIKIDNPDVVFDNVDPGKPASTSLVVRNSGNIPDTIEVTTDSDWMEIDPRQVTLEAKSYKEILITLKPEMLKKNVQLSGTIIVSTSSGMQLKAKVKVNASSGQICYKTTNRLDFGKVPRGTSKTMTFNISFEGKQSGKIVTKAPWISINPNSFNNSTSIDVSVTIAGSGLPGGERFEETIVILGNDLCRETRISIVTETEKEISILLAIGAMSAIINNKTVPLSAPPKIVKGSTMVPLRFIGEAFGCKVEWDGVLKKISLTRNSLAIILFLDKKEAIVNGQTKTLTAPPVSIKGKTMVPVRFIAETFGAKVNYNTKTGEISILWEPD